MTRFHGADTCRTLGTGFAASMVSFPSKQGFLLVTDRDGAFVYFVYPESARC